MEETSTMSEEDRKKREIDLMYQEREKEIQELREQAAKEYNEQVIQDKIQKKLQAKKLENLVITKYAQTRFLDNYDRDNDPVPKDIDKTIQKILANAEEISVNNIVFDTPSVKKMSLLANAVFYINKSTGYIFVIKSDYYLVTIEKGREQTNEEIEEENNIRKNLIDKGCQNIVISKHAIDRFRQRSDDKVKNPIKTILKLLVRSIPVKYTTHHVVRLLSNNLIEAQYFYNSG